MSTSRTFLYCLLLGILITLIIIPTIHLLTYQTNTIEIASDTYHPYSSIDIFHKQSVKYSKMKAIALKRTSKTTNIPNIYQKNMSIEHKRKWKGIQNINKEYLRIISNLQPLPSSSLNLKCNHTGKVFAIGMMKTGTTSTTVALHKLGYNCFKNSCEHIERNVFSDHVHIFQPLSIILLSLLNVTNHLNELYIAQSMKALAFGDSPWNFMYPIFDHWFPNSKYILTKRKSSRIYVNSYISYLLKYRKLSRLKGLTNEEFGNLVLRRYDLHNMMVEEYFKNRRKDLLIISYDDESHFWKIFNDFLGCNFNENEMFPKKVSSGRKKGGMLKEIQEMDIEWRERWNENEIIPYLTIDHKTRVQTLHVVNSSDFIFDWDIFLTQEMRDTFRNRWDYNTIRKV